MFNAQLAEFLSDLNLEKKKPKPELPLPAGIELEPPRKTICYAFELLTRSAIALRKILSKRNDIGYDSEERDLSGKQPGKQLKN